MRLDELTGQWVVFSSARSGRPRQTAAIGASTTPLSAIPRRVEACPFCTGNEHMLSEVLLRLPWGGALDPCDLRVVPNKYPAVDMLPTDACTTASFEEREHLLGDGILGNNEVRALGFHEVVIEALAHNAHLATSGPSHAEMLLRAFRERGRALQRHACVEHILYFKNHGSTAGASLVHPHSQVLASPIVPVTSQTLQDRALSYFKRHRRSIYAQLVREELEQEEEAGSHGVHRIVEASSNYVALVPYAATGPYAMMIVPRFDSANFTDTDDAQLEEAAHVLRRCLQRLHVLCAEPSFNLVLQSAPLPGRSSQAAYNASAFFRWHIKVVPRLGAGAMAGFELGSGLFSNSHFPEADAKELRDVDIRGL